MKILPLILFLLICGTAGADEAHNNAFWKCAHGFELVVDKNGIFKCIPKQPAKECPPVDCSMPIQCHFDANGCAEQDKSKRQPYIEKCDEYIGKLFDKKGNLEFKYSQLAQIYCLRAELEPSAPENNH